MYAVYRETYYPSEMKIQESNEFKSFQARHEEQPGYAGTIVTNVDDGRYLTVTLWRTEKDMHNAREALGQVVNEILNPIMASPPILLGTGPVILNDLNQRR